MSSQTATEIIIPLGSLVIAFLTLIFSTTRTMKLGAQEAAKTQVMLDNISTMLSEVKDDVKGISKKVDSHATHIAALEARVDELSGRVNRLENQDVKVGGSE